MENQPQAQSRNRGGRNRGGGGGNNNRNNKGCFNCGEVGHMARDCPTATAAPETTGKPALQQRNPNSSSGSAAPAASTKPASESQQQSQPQQQSKANATRNNNNNNNRNKKQRHGNPYKNTESFAPSHAPVDMRVVIDPNPRKLTTKLSVRDVLLCPTLFTQPGDETIYDRLVKEINACTIPNEKMLKLWHGDSHHICDDSTGWAKHSPTFQMVVERIRDYFNMKINATRFNFYQDQAAWKPLHFDAAAVKPNIARIQNFTVGVSFGCTRDAVFEEADSKKTVSFPLTNGAVYCFAREINCLWRHGILQVPPAEQKKEGRISVIAWGWVDQSEVASTAITQAPASQT